MFIVFVGPPGVGKGTQCRLLTKELGLLHLSTGEVLRQAIHDQNELGREAARYIDQGKLVPDATMIDLIDDQVTSSDSNVNGCLLDGFPRTLVQAKAFEQLLGKRNEKILVAIQLLADRDEVLKRLGARAGQEGRSDDDPETIVRRLEIFDQQTAPIVEYYRDRELLGEIDGFGKPKEVHARVFRCVQQAIDNSQNG